jgi:DNA-binding PadR family transcriptional regulator
MNRPNPSPQNAFPGLTSAQFHILLTLAEGTRHGYGIMLEVERRTEGAVELGPGTLYRSIKQLLDRGYITETSPGIRGDQDSGRESGPGKQRRSYGLTPVGRRRMVEEAGRLKALVEWAEDALAPGWAGK